MQDWLDSLDMEAHWLRLQFIWENQIWTLPTLIQLGVIVVVFVVALLMSRPVRARLLEVRKHPRLSGLHKTWRALDDLAIPINWLLLQWLVLGVADAAQWPHPLLTTTTSLLTAWVVIRLFSHWFDKQSLAHIVALSAWTVAALNILGLLSDTAAFLDKMAFTVGEVRVSVLLMIQGAFTFGLLIWLASALAGLAEGRLRRSKDITPAARVLIAKLTRIALIAVAALLALNAMGIDLTAFAVLSGALAVGLGFGLQKIFSNLVSGLILLLDKSIKPGDVISLGQTYGWINHLGARYVSVVTRDGVEHLIPNEELITQRVENWSHSDKFVRLRVPVGISYKSDPRRAAELCIEAAQMVPRVMHDPVPRCLVTGFGDSSVNLELRVWIADPENGRGSVISEIFLEIWDRFHDEGIEIPFPQRDLHIKSMATQTSTDITGITDTGSTE